MSSILIADKKLINSEDCKAWKFKDSLVVYSYKGSDFQNNVEGLKKIVNTYRQIWEKIIQEGTQSSIYDYNELLNNFERVGMISNITGMIGFVETCNSSRNISNMSVLMNDFDGEIVYWKNDVTGDPHILGISNNGKNFFTINNYL